MDCLVNAKDLIFYWLYSPTLLLFAVWSPSAAAAVRRGVQDRHVACQEPSGLFLLSSTWL